MKNLFTLLSHLWSSMGNLQSNDAICDRRLTVGSLSGLDAKWKQKGNMEQKGKMEQKEKITTSCLQLASYLPLTCPLHLSYAAVSRSRSACAPRTPSLFKDKSQLSFPSLASRICLCMLTVGVGNVWG